MAGVSKQNQRQGRTRKRQYDKYRLENHYGKNKCRKMLRVLRRNPTDTNARQALIREGKLLGKDYSGAL